MNHEGEITKKTGLLVHSKIGKCISYIFIALPKIKPPNVLSNNLLKSVFEKLCR